MIVIEIRRKKADYLVHINRYLFMIFRFFTAFCKGEKKTAADKKEIVRIMEIGEKYTYTLHIYEN